MIARYWPSALEVNEMRTAQQRAVVVLGERKQVRIEDSAVEFGTPAVCGSEHDRRGVNCDAPLFAASTQGGKDLRCAGLLWCDAVAGIRNR
jgi:hypothetical protein